jgi:hypothetical protein
MNTLTPEQIDQLEAGRELDALIGERVTYWWGKYQTRSDHDLPVPPYSTDIAAAWQVVEQLARQGIALTISTYGIPSFYTTQNDTHSEGTFVYLDSIPDTRPLTQRCALGICRAALKAVHATAPTV